MVKITKNKAAYVLKLYFYIRYNTFAIAGVMKNEEVSACEESRFPSNVRVRYRL